MSSPRPLRLVGTGELEPRRARRTTALLSAGAMACPLFCTAFLVEGARRRDYDPRRHPVSSLALGPQGWRQTANFSIAGLLVLCGSAGLHRSADAHTARAVAPLVAAAGAGLVGAAVFPTDPVSGYPPGSAPAPDQLTRRGAAHNLAAVPVFLGFPVASALVAVEAAHEGHHGWAAYSGASGAAMLVTTGLFGAGFGQNPRLVDHAGLLQRLSIGCWTSWLSALCIRTLQRRRR